MGTWGADAFRQNPLKLEFAKGTIKPGETTTLVATVTNIEKQDAAVVIVSLEAKEKGEFQVFPRSEGFNGTISLISAGSSREVTFVINPVQKVLPGTYTFVAKTTLNGKEYSKEAVLAVRQN